MAEKNDKMIELRGQRSQKEIADQIGIPVSTYAMIESGHRFPRRELQAKLANFFNITVDELFFCSKWSRFANDIHSLSNEFLLFTETGRRNRFD